VVRGHGEASVDPDLVIRTSGACATFPWPSPANAATRRGLLPGAAQRPRAGNGPGQTDSTESRSRPSRCPQGRRCDVIPEACRIARRHPAFSRTQTSVYLKVMANGAPSCVPFCRDSTSSTATSPYVRVAIRRRSKSSNVIRPVSASSQVRFPTGSGSHPAVVIRKSSRSKLALADKSPSWSACNSLRSTVSRSSTRFDDTDRYARAPQTRATNHGGNTLNVSRRRCGCAAAASRSPRATGGRGPPSPGVART